MLNWLTKLGGDASEREIKKLRPLLDRINSLEADYQALSDEALRDKIIVGTPEQVTDRLMGLKEELGLDGILAEMNCGTKIPHHRVMKSLQLLCEKVKPQFH